MCVKTLTNIKKKKIYFEETVLTFSPRSVMLHSISYFYKCASVELRFCLFIQLTQITRTGQCTWESKNILAVSFAPLVQQNRADGEKPDTVQLREFSSLRLKQKQNKKNHSLCLLLCLTSLDVQNRQY